MDDKQAATTKEEKFTLKKILYPVALDPLLKSES